MPPNASKIAELSNQFEDDRVLRGYLKRVCPGDVLQDIRPSLQELGELTGGELYDLQLRDRVARPELTQWDAQGNRIDHVELTDSWKRALREAANHGLIATAYEQKHGRFSRIHQMAKAYLFAPSTDMVGFLLATTDGATRTLIDMNTPSGTEEAVRHFTSRDPDAFWTCGQWRTEQAGGTDLSRIKTKAVQSGDRWTLHGRKWFTSSSVANAALVLAHPERASGGDSTNGTQEKRDGLGLFYVPIRSNRDAPPNDGIAVNRLKENLGARKIPVSEIALDGARAYPLETRFGTRYLTPMVELARIWNAVMATGFMRRGLALARDFSRKREAFGTPIIEKPLHYDTLASIQSTMEGAFHLTFRTVELLGKLETGELDDQGTNLLRALTPIVKLLTAKQAVGVIGEVVEAFGGAGYVEETGIPLLLRDVQALTIWEGTTNVMSLIAMQSLRRDGRLEAIKQELVDCREAVESPVMEQAVQTAQDAFRSAVSWLAEAIREHPDTVEAGARRFAMTIGKSLELALLARHAQWSMTEEGNRAVAVVEHFATQGIDEISPRRTYDAKMLAQDYTQQTLFRN
jgi:alkylation response protein AidB-like acyl-CoA dehydrogenase